jgi:P27 family predicted phage terminase small subunit
MTLQAIDGGAGTPPEPDWSSIYSDDLDIASAHEEWCQVVSELRTAKALSVAVGHAIKRLVGFRIEYERASRAIIDQGAVTKAKRTGVQKYNLFWTVLRQSHEAITTLEAELGVSPTRRSKIVPLSGKRAKTRASDDYLGAAGR